MEKNINRFYTYIYLDPRRKGKTWVGMYGEERAKELREEASIRGRKFTHTNEVKKKIGVKNSGKNNGMYGHIYSDDERDHLSRNLGKEYKIIFNDSHYEIIKNFSRFCRQNNLTKGWTYLNNGNCIHKNGIKVEKIICKEKLNAINN
jgi:hypothetical protein